MADIFNFNHIDSTIEEEKLEEIKELYKYYHKRFWCYKKVYKRSYLLNNLASTALVSAASYIYIYIYIYI